MIRISALNDSSSDDESDSQNDVRTTTKEAQEAEAFVLYNKALGYQGQSEMTLAKNTLQLLLASPFLVEASEILTAEKETISSVHPGLQLLYSTHKNLANIALQEGDDKLAIESFLQAVLVDTTEVTVWYKIGTLALKICNLPLARLAFHQGLECNPRHWPCLDAIITVLYALTDYTACLHYVAQGLERDSGYIKALAYRQQIYTEVPSLKKDNAHLFKLCDPVIDESLEKQEVEECIAVALALREQRRELTKRPQPKPVMFLKPLSSFTWCCLGKSLVSLYDHMRNSDPPLSMTRRVDLTEYVTLDKQTQEEHMETDCPGENMNPSQPAESVQATAQHDQPTESVQIADAAESPKSINQIPDTNPDSTAMVTSVNDIIECVNPIQEMKDENKSQEMKADLQNMPSPKGIGSMVEVENMSCVVLLGSDVITSRKHIHDADNDDRFENKTEESDAAKTEDSDEGTSDSKAGADTADSQDIAAAMETDERFTSDGCERMEHDKEKVHKEGHGEVVGSSKPTPVSALRDQPLDLSSRNHKRGLKRKHRPWWEDEGIKRRSTRVRNTSQKKKQEEEIVNFNDLLQKFLPSTLCPSDGECNDVEMMIIPNSSLKTDGLHHSADSVNERLLLSDNECGEVREYLNKGRKGGGIIPLMHEFLLHLARNHDKIWPTGLQNIYVDIFCRLRKHIWLTEYLCRSVCCEERIRDEAMMVLLAGEFRAEQCLRGNTKSPIKTPDIKIQDGRPFANNNKSSSGGIREEDFLGPQTEADIIHITGLVGYSNIMADIYHQFAVRVYWLKAHLFALQDETEEAVYFYEQTKVLLLDNADEDSKPVCIPNCKIDHVITIQTIDNNIESLQRCQSLEEMQTLYESGSYQRIIDTLTPTFIKQRHDDEEWNPDIPAIQERHDQIKMLLNALGKEKDFQKCLFYGELAFNEVFQFYKRAPLSIEKDQWANTFLLLFVKFNRYLTRDAGSLKSLPSANLIRFTQNLINIIDLCMDIPETITEMPVNSVLPWIILYRIIKYEEEKERSRSEDHVCEALSQAMSSSLMLINVAHDYLGRRGWCTHSDGALLLFFMDIIQKEQALFTEENVHPFKEDLDQAFEQCVFCLYCHPNKKGRTKYLQEHNANQITLTWERCVVVFDYFKPICMPEFDGYKTSYTITAEVETLFTRMSLLVPDHIKPAHLRDSLNDYIEGHRETFPDVTDVKSPVVSELYYLLADYYFKNQEQLKAIKFYLLDLSLTPYRLDSWAGLALARMSCMEQKLNSSELKMDTSVEKQASTVLRCFSSALSLDVTNCKLWIEYGSMAYQLHSHASRQLKMQHWFPLDDEMQKSAKLSYDEMLKLAEKCYKTAYESEEYREEEWLLHYMLGKIAQKTKQSPRIYLEHYKQAAWHLHQDGAVYPKKITYVVSPPPLAVEALEMYYHLHASIFRLVIEDKSRTDYLLFDQYMSEAALGPFSTANEKRFDKKDGREASSQFSTSDSGQEGGASDHAMSADQVPVRQMHQHAVPDKSKGDNALAGESEVAHVSNYENITSETMKKNELVPINADAKSISIDIIKPESAVPSNDEDISMRSPTNLSPRSKPTSFLVADILSPRTPTSRERISDGASTPGSLSGSLSSPDQNASAKDQSHRTEKPSTMQQQQQQQPQQEPASNKSTPPVSASPDTVRRKTLIAKCMKAFYLCLMRFPQHYKALYKLSYAYYKSPYHKNLEYARDMFLGQPNWSQLHHMPAQGLFGDRRNNDFFRSIWRIPSEEIDRSGNFSSHMLKALQLLVDVLKAQRDNVTLFMVHQQMSRPADVGKKFLRDPERIRLAQLAFECTLEVIEVRLEKLIKVDSAEKLTRFLLDVYRVHQHGPPKVNQMVNRFNMIFVRVYKALLMCLKKQPGSETPMLEQAVKFCQIQHTANAAKVAAAAAAAKPAQVESTKPDNLDSPRFSSPAAQIIDLTSPLGSPHLSASPSLHSSFNRSPSTVKMGSQSPSTVKMGSQSPSTVKMGSQSPSTVKMGSQSAVHKNTPPSAHGHSANAHRSPSVSSPQYHYKPSGASPSTGIKASSSVSQQHRQQQQQRSHPESRRSTSGTKPGFLSPPSSAAASAGISMSKLAKDINAYASQPFIASQLLNAFVSQNLLTQFLSPTHAAVLRNRFLNPSLTRSPIPSHNPLYNPVGQLSYQDAFTKQLIAERLRHEQLNSVYQPKASGSLSSKSSPASKTSSTTTPSKPKSTYHHASMALDQAAAIRQSNKLGTSHRSPQSSASAVHHAKPASGNPSISAPVKPSNKLLQELQGQSSGSSAARLAHLAGQRPESAQSSVKEQVRHGYQS